MTFAWSAFFGFFLGFVFGVGCALAVLYSIYSGGYRAAVRDATLPVPPPRLAAALKKVRSPPESISLQGRRLGSFSDAENDSQRT